MNIDFTKDELNIIMCALQVSAIQASIGGNTEAYKNFYTVFDKIAEACEE